MNLATILILSGMCAVVALIVRKLIRDKRNGKTCSSCGGSCSSCACCSCHRTAEKG